MQDLQALIVIILLFCAQPAFAGAWTLPQGKTLAISSLELSRLTIKQFGYEIKHTKKSAEQFIEYGLTNDQTFGFKSIFNHQTFRASGIAAYSLLTNYYGQNCRGGLCDELYHTKNAYPTIVNLYLRNKLYDKKFVLSIQPMISWPDQAVEFRALLGLNRKVKLYNSFFNVELAYTKQHEAPDLFKIDLSEGVDINYNLTALMQIFLTYDLNKTKKFRQFFFSRAVIDQIPTIRRHANDQDIITNGGVWLANPNYTKFKASTKFSFIYKLNHTFNLQPAYIVNYPFRNVIQHAASISLWINF